jgi:regulator of nucleoside diphosphate kinase
MNEEAIIILNRDFVRIRHILSFQKSIEFENLEMELDRAKIIEENEKPNGLVTMERRFKFGVIQEDKQEDKQMVITIVYPVDASFADGKISILAPLGSALIGLQVGQEIDWQFPDGKTKRLKILEVY